jgi:hypothetical protein
MVQVSQGRLGFKLILGDASKPEVTAYAGLPLVVEAVLAVIAKKQFKALAKAIGFMSWQTVRRHVLSLVTLITAGGECIDDLETLRADPGLSTLLGFDLSSPTQMKDFLYRFHQAEDGRPLTKEDDERLTVVGQAQIRPEGPGLRVLVQMGQHLIDSMQSRRPVQRATVDVDATIIEAHKKQALVAYEGTRGYQPQMAWWAEQRVWICDEFRDGNVPAEFDLLAFLKKAFCAVPAVVSDRRLRGDSALYNEAALTWAADEAHVQFAVSADMSPALVSAVVALPHEVWKSYRTLREDDRQSLAEEREWAEVDFVPGWARNNKEGATPFRYLAIRVRSRQRDLLVADSQRWKHFAVVTNMNWGGERLLRWHREKQGTVEQGHDVTKNELAGGALPCGRFGANAAWWRINTLTSNLLQLLKAEALPAEMGDLKPKGLRFRLFNVAGRLTYHGRQIWLRISEKLPVAEAYSRAREVLLRLDRGVALPAAP